MTKENLTGRILAGFFSGPFHVELCLTSCLLFGLPSLGGNTHTSVGPGPFAIPKYHELGDLEVVEVYWFHFWKQADAKSRQRQTLWLVKTILPLPGDILPLSSHDGRAMATQY